MGSRTARIVVPLVVAAVVLFAANWIDGEWLVAARRRAGTTFDMSGVGWALPVGYLTAAAGIILLAALGWWSRSLLVGIAYALVGAFYAFLVTLTWVFAARVNGAPAILPEPIAQFVGNLGASVGQGPAQAVSTIGAGMLIAGLMVIGRSLLGGRRQAAVDGPDATAAAPERP